MTIALVFGWMGFVYFALAHYARTTRLLLEQNRELARGAWAAEVASRGGTTASLTGSLIHASSTQADNGSPSPFGIPVRDPTEEELLARG